MNRPFCLVCPSQYLNFCQKFFVFISFPFPHSPTPHHHRRCTLDNPYSAERCTLCEAPRRCNVPLSVPEDFDLDSVLANIGHSSPRIAARSPPQESSSERGSGMTSTKDGCESPDKSSEEMDISGEEYNTARYITFKLLVSSCGQGR